jgi:hypothetical protein
MAKLSLFSAQNSGVFEDLRHIFTSLGFLPFCHCHRDPWLRLNLAAATNTPMLLLHRGRVALLAGTDLDGSLQLETL